MKINWKHKLSSRKFWLALVGFITPIMVMFKVPNETVVVVTTIIMSGAALIAYIIAEGFIDANNTEDNSKDVGGE